MSRPIVIDRREADRRLAHRKDPMNKNNVAMLAVFCASLAACAGQDEKLAEDGYKAPVYRTGSNLPAGRESGASGESRELSAAERRAIETTCQRRSLACSV